MTINNLKILVTGADGFIGSHLTEELVGRGYEVRAFVLYNSFNSWGWLDHVAPEIKHGFEIFAGDVREVLPQNETVIMRGSERWRSGPHAAVSV
jgi:nucleoside-diphosphate-sugar epimerase